MASKLSTANVLQDPQEFCDCIKESVPKVADREIIAEILGGTCNFKQWVEQLNIKLSGITATHQMHDPEITHVWRIMSRELLKSAGFEDGAILQPDEWKDVAHGGHDSILLLKHFMSSFVYSQAPMLLLPEALAKNLKKDEGRPDYASQTRRPKKTQMSPNPWTTPQVWRPRRATRQPRTAPGNSQPDVKRAFGGPFL